MTFDLDANGILNVKAVDKASGKEQKITITASSGLSKEEVEKMKKDAEVHAEEDKKKKELIEVRNSADGLVYSTEKTLKENGEKVSAEVKQQVEEKLEALKKVKDGDNIEEIKTAFDALGEVIQKVGSELYKQPEASAEQPTSEEKKDENVQDAEFKDKEGESEQTGK